MVHIFSIESILFINKLSLIIIIYYISYIEPYGPTGPTGPTSHYRVPIWVNRQHIERNEIYSPHIFKPYSQPSFEPIKMSAFAVVPELLFNIEGKFVYHREYSPKLSLIYTQYLAKEFYSGKCQQELGDTSGDTIFLTEEDFGEAFAVADQQIKEYENSNQQYLSIDSRGLNFSAYIFVATLHSKYNEFTTEYLTKKKCIDKYSNALIIPSVPIPPSRWNNRKYCDLDKPDSHHISCNPNFKYRRIDGKCNNLINANWGSSFHCHRRLLPPDYADGIEKPRISTDGTPLPSPRLITELLMPDLELIDPKLTAMNMIWGQFLVHDVFRTIQYLGLAINCCQSPNQLVHPECIPITNFPPDRATIALNQRCINTVRSTACNTCSLGPRDQMNVATQVLDLSNVYGGNLMNNSHLLRSFIRGQMRSSFDINGDETLPIRNLPQDQDTLDLTSCNEPINRPDLTCFHSGDGIRANQNPGVNSIHVVMHKRHNQHAEALSKVNPHWDDETLFQEARRLLIAEANKINFGEYLPSILGKRLMDYFDLNLEEVVYTKYNPNLDPSSIQAVGVAALRMGHSQIPSLFRANGIIRGLIEDPNRNVDPFITSDVKNFLFFNPRTPRIVDLPAININRGRDHGVPAYVHYLRYCTGIEIKSWADLHKFIPINKVNKLRSVYRHYKDIDLFIGGLSEVHLAGSILGPTFACLNGIQFYHWKFGDRFYFEHGGEAGSFTLDQLNNIRQTSSLANLLCKTTDIENIQMNVMFQPSDTNPKTSCNSFTEIDYELWRETQAFYPH